ncbi:hypothetical protein PFICI_08228 [Pestalotiopsis fici W106-1]|uniref:Uncharacterized protein n=1 Tax=Pestalotiopsis fici (strain W106-1 / CGMCC3.15140) TaxID=1229662 RepID=W3X3W6_PESFW|nr:uncharacterized protein PFICI_08228 [Pestalotiopsis fici W106-1]ETS80699.1 hypothetical protein PFICI_08228 [Pestalotiopsis fici W106-1]
MWLLDTSNYSLVEIFRPEDFQYAILSHTWNSGNEVSFQDLRNLDRARQRSGWTKIERTCKLAAQQNIKFAWVDTCCIDKTNNTELAEAINSMFEWYKLATICYVYLEDLPSSSVGPESKFAQRQMAKDLVRCKWFGRGWTLQELIAPSSAEFFDRDWILRGNKKSLQHQLSQITDIELGVLANSEDLSSIPVARKMAWAAKRKTTRIEDIAYSLLGIFNVNMPLIYGEGMRAFLRLQEAIAQSTYDLSLFAWSDDEENPQTPEYNGIFAQTPMQFSRCGTLLNIESPALLAGQSFNLTNRGVEFETYLRRDTSEGDFEMCLFCAPGPRNRRKYIYIRLVKTVTGYVRHRTQKLFYLSEDSLAWNDWDPHLVSVRVPRVLSLTESAKVKGRLENSFVITTPTKHIESLRCEFFPNIRPDLSRDDINVPWYYDASSSRILTSGSTQFTGMLYLAIMTDENEIILVAPIFCGLAAKKDKDKTETSGSLAVQPPIPWVMISVPNTWSKGKTKAEVASNLHNPYFLLKEGRIVRGLLNMSHAPTPPTSISFSYGTRDFSVNVFVEEKMMEGTRTFSIQARISSDGQKKSEKPSPAAIEYKRERPEENLGQSNRDALVVS